MSEDQIPSDQSSGFAPISLARITVVEHIYHQCLSRATEPYSIQSGFTRHTAVVEQPYNRWCTVGESWQKIDVGWMQDCLAMLVVVNNEDPPSDKNLHLSFFDEDDPNPSKYWVIPPGESFKGTPSSSDLVIRSSGGTARFTIHCLPG